MSCHQVMPAPFCVVARQPRVSVSPLLPVMARTSCPPGGTSAWIRDAPRPTPCNGCLCKMRLFRRLRVCKPARPKSSKYSSRHMEKLALGLACNKHGAPTLLPYYALPLLYKGSDPTMMCRRARDCCRGVRDYGTCAAAYKNPGRWIEGGRPAV